MKAMKTLFALMIAILMTTAPALADSKFVYQLDNRGMTIYTVDRDPMGNTTIYNMQTGAVGLGQTDDMGNETIINFGPRDNLMPGFLDSRGPLDGWDE
jgi:hypothetical protein